MSTLQLLAYLAAGLYALSVTILAVYGLHSVWLLWRFLRHHRAAMAQQRTEDATPLSADLPHVLVQLPVFNERDVVVRLLDACARLDWPKDRLHLQLLDDSTDDSVEIGRAACARLRAQGFDAVSIHRVDRTGYKAGALENGMAHSDAPFIAIFDADFVPEPDFIKRAVKPLLADPGLGLVQGRWDHLNREQNALTKAQAMGIDAHFAIEQGARAWSGLAMNFNGTCGMWRRQAIIDGGGWEHDTLTEDMDLSYRSQLKGWRCTYRLDLAVPGELPATVSAWRHQQFRWAKGSIQTAIKLLPRIWRSPWGITEKLASSLHMTHYMVHPLILISLFCAPLALTLVKYTPTWVLMLGLIGFLIGALSPIIVYIASQYVLRGWPGLKRLRVLPVLAAIGTGIAVSNAKGCWQAIRGQQSAFVRTPKQGTGAGSYRAKSASGMPELFCAAWAMVGLGVGVSGPHVWVTPLLALYFSGFVRMWWFSYRERRDAEAAAKAEAVPVPATPSALPHLALPGLLLVGGAAALAAIGSWRDQPVLAGGIALVMAAVWLFALGIVRARGDGRGVLAWILIVALAMRCAALGIGHDDALNRTMAEGLQLARASNPYAEPPVGSVLAWIPGLFDQVPRHDQTSHAGPVAVLWSGLIASFDSARTLVTFKVAGMLFEAAAIGLLVALLARWRMPRALVLAAAWNPVLALFVIGSGTGAPIALLLVAWSLYVLSGAHRKRGLITGSLATLAHPVAAPVLLAQLPGRGWGAAVIPLAVLGLALLPFTSAGTGLMGILAPFSLAQPFGGALEPLARWLLSGFTTDPDALRLALTVVLAGVWLAASAFVLWRHLRRGHADDAPANAELMLRLFAVLLICLPTVQPWMFGIMALLLPFTRSWGFAVWTATACAWWLHGMGSVGTLTEQPLVTALIHLPALVLLGWEAVGRVADETRNDEVPAEQRN